MCYTWVQPEALLQPLYMETEPSADVFLSPCVKVVSVQQVTDSFPEKWSRIQTHCHTEEQKSLLQEGWYLFVATEGF